MIRFRLSPFPSRALPLNVRSAGHYRFVAGHRETREAGHFLQLFWNVAGAGQIALNDRLVTVPANSLFYYAEGEVHELIAGPTGWEYRWLTFDGPEFKRIVETYKLRRVQPANPCPAWLFEQLDGALRDPTPAGESFASVLAYEILLRATESPSGPVSLGDNAAETARVWLDAHYVEARLNVTSLAGRFGLHRSSLHRQFTRRHGVAPVQYLARLRLRKGLELLAGTSLSVTDVAVQCGLPDVAYFSKLVSRHTGHSPREYRRRQIAAAPARRHATAEPA